MKHTIKKNPTQQIFICADCYATVVASNAHSNYAIAHINKTWYVFGVRFGENKPHTMAGFDTKKTATACAEHWAATH